MLRTSATRVRCAHWPVLQELSFWVRRTCRPSNSSPGRNDQSFCAPLSNGNPRFEPASGSVDRRMPSAVHQRAPRRTAATGRRPRCTQASTLSSFGPSRSSRQHCLRTKLRPTIREILRPGVDPAALFQQRGHAWFHPASSFQAGAF